MTIICIKSTAECNRSYIILKFKAKEFKYKSTYLDGTCIIENFLIGLHIRSRAIRSYITPNTKYIYLQICSKHKCVKNKNQTFV